MAAGDVLADVQTDKATMAFESQEDGYLAKILVQAGSAELKIGAPVAIMVEDASAVAAFASYTAAAAASAAPAAAPAAAASGAAGYAGHRLWPTVRRLLSEHGLQPAAVVPTGPHGVLTRGDVLAAVAGGARAAPAAHAAAAAAPRVAAAPAAAASPAPAAPAAAAVSPATPPPPRGGQSHVDTPASNVRKIIASRLLASKRGSPHLYVSREAGLDALMALRKELAAAGAKASVNDFVIRAAAVALARVPAAAALQPGASIDIAIAVATPGGLMTPIVFGADKMVRIITGRNKTGRCLLFRIHAARC